MTTFVGKDGICKEDPTKQVVFDIINMVIAPEESYEDVFHRLCLEFCERNKAKNFNELRVFDDILNLRFSVYAFGEDSFHSEECSILHVPYKILFTTGIQAIKPSWEMLQSAHRVFADDLLKLLLEPRQDGKPPSDAVCSVPPVDGPKDKDSAHAD